MRPINKRKLTQLHVTRMSPQAKTFCFWDTEQKGLCLQVRPNGYRAYKVVYQHQKRTRWFHLGAVNEISLGQARRLAQEVMYQKAQGRDPHGERHAQRQTGTFADLVEAYFSQHAEKANRSWKQARYLIDRHLLPRWGGLVPSSITRSHVKALMREVTAPVMANQTLAAASAIFSWAIREEVAGVTANPCLKVKRNAVTSRERILSDAELPLFWNAFSQAGEAGKVLKLILLTGQRPGEVAAMKREHVESGWWTMPGEPDGNGWPGVKNKRAHRIWLPQAAWEVLPLSYYTTTQLATTMRAICAQLGVTNKVTPHDLRRSFLSTITRLRFSRHLMDVIANHKTDTVTDIYDRHSYAAEIKTAMETVAAEIVHLAEGRPSEPNVVALR